MSKPVIAIQSVSVDHCDGWPKIHIDFAVVSGEIGPGNMDYPRLADAIAEALSDDKPDGKPATPKPKPNIRPVPDVKPPEYVDSGIHKGCEWCISRFMGHYCAYICVEHIRKFKSYDECELSVHGGLTWLGSVDHVPGMKSGGRNWLGWDYNHLDDEEHGWQPVEVKNEVLEAIEEFTERYGE